MQQQGGCHQGNQRVETLRDEIINWLYEDLMLDKYLCSGLFYLTATLISLCALNIFPAHFVDC